MKIATALIALALPGCAGLPQLDLKEGQVGCQTVTSVWVRGSNVVARADNIPKGSNADGKSIIKCGEATLEIEHKNDRSSVQSPPIVGFSLTPVPAGQVLLTPSFPPPVTKPVIQNPDAPNP